MRAAPGPYAGRSPDAALLARVLGGGRPARRHRLAASRMLRETRGLFGLASTHPALLRSLHREAPDRPGDETEQQEVRADEAAVEIARRLAGAAVDRSDPLRDLDALAAYLALRYFRRDQEVVGALYLGGAGRWLAEEPVFLGTMHRTRFEPRQFLAHALTLATEEAGPIASSSSTLNRAATARRAGRTCSTHGEWRWPARRSTRNWSITSSSAVRGGGFRCGGGSSAD